jgi:hypothetical protein
VSVRSVQLAYLTARRFQPHRTQGLKLLHDPAFAGQVASQVGAMSSLGPIAWTVRRVDVAD